MYIGVWHYNKLQCCEPRQRRTKSAYRKRLKSSVRQRPREEWIPLELPASLQLIPRDRWERVQATLKRNITFSPRNEKHPYLLKGLVRCGGCGARYGGDSWHGRFYYRCLARCKRLPAVREFRLERLILSRLSAHRRKMCALSRPQLQQFLQRQIEESIFDGTDVSIKLAGPNGNQLFPTGEKM